MVARGMRGKTSGNASTKACRRAASSALRPLATFVYNYFLRLGFLDGREGLLLHLNHAVYVSWKYAKAWELSRKLSRDKSK